MNRENRADPLRCCWGNRPLEQRGRTAFNIDAERVGRRPLRHDRHRVTATADARRRRRIGGRGRQFRFAQMAAGGLARSLVDVDRLPQHLTPGGGEDQHQAGRDDGESAERDEHHPVLRSRAALGSAFFVTRPKSWVIRKLGQRPTASCSHGTQAIWKVVRTSQRSFRRDPIS